MKLKLDLSNLRDKSLLKWIDEQIGAYRIVPTVSFPGATDHYIDLDMLIDLYDKLDNVLESIRSGIY